MSAHKAKARRALLRVCASCEWLFVLAPDRPATGCPKCGFGHYGARSVYGDKTYRYAKTQRPWLTRKMAAYAAQLQAEIDAG